MRRTFGAPSPRPEELELSKKYTEFDRTLATFDRGQIVSTAGIFSFEMAVPGERSLPCAGVTRVTVLSTHRRRGLLTAMMRRQMDDAHERGEPLAALYASEAPIYGRFGYGIATYDVELEISRGRSAFRAPAAADGRGRFIEKAQAIPLVTELWNRLQPTQPGMLAHRETWWEGEFADFEHWRDGASEQYLVIYEDQAGRAQGFAQYRVKLPWTDNLPDGTLTILLLIAATPQAYAALWRHCLDVDLMARVKAGLRRVDEPLRFLMQDPRAPRPVLNESVWLRLVDVPKALAGRRYATASTLVLEVRDAFCPWNQGRYQLEGDAERATCVPTRAEPDLTIDAADLAALYLGGNLVSTLAEAGRIEERHRGALKRAGAMFHPERVPWCPSHF